MSPRGHLNLNWRSKGPYRFVKAFSESQSDVEGKGRAWDLCGQSGGSPTPGSTQSGPQDLGGAHREPSKGDTGEG